MPGGMAIDLGKFKSFVCIYERISNGETKFYARIMTQPHKAHQSRWAALPRRTR